MTKTKTAGVAKIAPDSRTIGLLVPMAIAMLALGAFVLSFAALRQVAAAANVPHALAWIWPVIIDAGVIVNVAAALVLRARGQSTIYPWTSMSIGVAISVVGNAVHATVDANGALHLPPLIAMTVAAVPPLVLMQATHLGALVLVQPEHPTHQAVAAEQVPPAESQREITPVSTSSAGPVTTGRAPERDPEEVYPDPADSRAKVDRQEPPLRSAAPSTSPAANPHLHLAADPLDNLAQQLRRAHDNGERLTGHMVSEMLGVSQRTGSRRLKEVLDRHPNLGADARQVNE